MVEVSRGWSRNSDMLDNDEIDLMTQIYHSRKSQPKLEKLQQVGNPGDCDDDFVHANKFNFHMYNAH